MKTLAILIFSLFASSLPSAAFAAHDGFDGKCQTQGTLAIRAINKLNGHPIAGDPDVEFVRKDGNAEIYQAGKDGPTYTVTVKLGSSESACTIETLEYNPEG